jgi:hypothetical protein
MAGSTQPGLVGGVITSSGEDTPLRTAAFRAEPCAAPHSNSNSNVNDLNTNNGKEGGARYTTEVCATQHTSR